MLQIKKLLVVFLFSIWNNLGNIGYFCFWIWFAEKESHYNLEVWQIMQLLYLNHLQMILPSALLLFFVREFIKNK